MYFVNFIRKIKKKKINNNISNYNMIDWLISFLQLSAQEKMVLNIKYLQHDQWPHYKR